jgi:hypothetical protein
VSLLDHQWPEQPALQTLWHSGFRSTKRSRRADSNRGPLHYEFVPAVSAAFGRSGNPVWAGGSSSPETDSVSGSFGGSCCFAELTLEDVAQIIATIGEERETLFLERKAALSTNSLAKACSAFANTYGGLLVAGVADESDELTGMLPVAAEPQLWVKDTLRSLVLPLPPFRARWLPTEGERGLLLVLVEESSTTPHLLTRSGAIYVRNPGSSDPVPIADQVRLLELSKRGDEARIDAIGNARRALAVRASESASPMEIVGVAVTGVAANFEERLFAASTFDYLSLTTWGEQADTRRDGRLAAWAQHHVGVRRVRMADLHPTRSHVEEGVVVTRAGAVVIYRGFLLRDDDNQSDGHTDTVTESELRARFEPSLRAAREILTEFGGHGDLRVAYRLAGGHSIHFEVPMIGPRDVGETTIGGRGTSAPGRS